MSYTHVTGKTPEHVILICLGETKREYADILAADHRRRWPNESERWTLNAGFRIWRHDVLFVLDDLEGEAHKWPDYGEDLVNHDRPIITSEAYSTFPMAEAYPFEWMVEKLKLEGLDRYFYNSVPLILAYALAIGVKRMTVFGADYHHPNQPGREGHFGNANWWVGYCRGKGMQFELASDTTLMDARHAGQPMYGYRFDPRLTVDRKKALLQQQRALQPGDSNPWKAEDEHTLAHLERKASILEQAMEKTAKHKALGPS